jgi:hypothetical protein
MNYDNNDENNDNTLNIKYYHFPFLSFSLLSLRNKQGVIHNVLTQ